MDKALKENISQILEQYFMACGFEKGDVEGRYADAIIALLQPRMLNKDEAFCLLQRCEDCPKYDCPKDYWLKLVAKLKLIQEEE